MRYLIGLGSSLGDKARNLEIAAREIKKLFSGCNLAVSPVYVTPALVLPGSPADWQVPYFNAVAMLTNVDLNPDEMLAVLKGLEIRLGREPAPRWAPRRIDLDLLDVNNEIIETPQLRLPHPEMMKRSFVMDPLKDVAPLWRHSQGSETAVQIARKLAGRQSLLMGILNVTPDSFSDGGQYSNLSSQTSLIDLWSERPLAYIDLGAESTRPQATSISIEEEVRRLWPVLTLLENRFGGNIFRPKISLDTYHPATARRVLKEFSIIDVINDVSGFADLEMLQILQDYPAVDYVLMHSLGVPPLKDRVLPDAGEPTNYLVDWFDRKISWLEREGIATQRIILDPGLGFGKTAEQSLRIISDWSRFSAWPFRWMVGHSRKAFIRGNLPLGNLDAIDRETVKISLCLYKNGVDILRVHNIGLHQEVFNHEFNVR